MMASFVSVVSEPLQSLGARYASDTQCEMLPVDSWKYLSSDNTVVVFGSREDITPALLYQARTLAVHGIDVGFMTGRSLLHIEAFADRNRQGHRALHRLVRSLTLEPMAMDPSDATHANHMILRGADASQGAVWEYLQTAPCDVLTIIAHGRDDNVYLADATICGRTLLAQRLQTTDAHFPACSFGHVCHKDKPLVMAPEMTVQVVFINACFGLKTQDATFHGDYTLALGFVEGYTSHIVASDTMQPGQPYYNQLFVERLREGWTIGRVVAELNNQATARGLDITRFNLLGDPRFRYTPEVDRVARSRAPAIRLMDHGALPDSTAIALGNRITALQHIPQLRLPLPQWSGRMQELQRRFHHFIESYRATLHQTRQPAAVAKTLQSLEKTCDELDQQILQYLLDKTNRHNFHFVENYREQLWVGPESVTQCPGCGSWALTYPVHEYYTVEPLRQIIDCPQCGIAQDTPPHPRITTALDFEPTIAKGSPWTIDITVTSRVEWAVPVRLMVGVAEGFRRNIQFTVSPTVAELGSYASIGFHATTTLPEEAPGLREHNYWLRVYTVANSELYFDHRNFWVVSSLSKVQS